MRLAWKLIAGMAVLAGSALTAPELNLRGDRFKPLVWDELTPAQKTMAQNLLDGERGGLGGPFNVLLRSPEMGDLAAKFGGSMRFHSSVPSKINEMAIIMTARAWTSQYEWYAHKRAARTAGLADPIIDAIATGKRPTGMSPDEDAAYTFCNELLKTHQVSDATFAAAKARFGERGVVDLMGVMGWYHLVAMVLNTDRYPMPDGVKPELQPLP